MEGPSRARTPQAVLFACGLNSVRSPMAESLLQHMFPKALYVKSAGVRTVSYTHLTLPTKRIV